jgi:hypothetical protein
MTTTERMKGMDLKLSRVEIFKSRPRLDEHKPGLALTILMCGSAGMRRRTTSCSQSWSQRRAVLPCLSYLGDKIPVRGVPVSFAISRGEDALLGFDCIGDHGRVRPRVYFRAGDDHMRIDALVQGWEKREEEQNRREDIDLVTGC